MEEVEPRVSSAIQLSDKLEAIQKTAVKIILSDT